MLVFHRVADPGGKAVMPESAVAHDAHGALLVGHHQGRGAGRAQAVAGDGVADVERGNRGKGVAADVHAYLQFAEFLLQQLDRGEERAFRASGTQAGRPLGHQLLQFFPVRAVGLFQRRNGSRAGFPARQEFAQPLLHQLAGVLPGHGKHVLAVHPGLHVVASQDGVDVLFQVVRLAFLHQQHRLFVTTETHYLRIDQGISYVQDIHGDGVIAEHVGTSHVLHGPVQGVVEAAGDDNTDILEAALYHVVQAVLLYEFQRRRPALFGFFRLMLIVERGQDDALHVPRRVIEGIGHGKCRAPVVPGIQYAVDVAGPHPQLQHHGCG